MTEGERYSWGVVEALSTEKPAPTQEEVVAATLRLDSYRLSAKSPYGRALDVVFAALAASQQDVARLKKEQGEGRIVSGSVYNGMRARLETAEGEIGAIEAFLGEQGRYLGEGRAPGAVRVLWGDYIDALDRVSGIDRELEDLRREKESLRLKAMAVQEGEHSRRPSTVAYWEAEKKKAQKHIRALALETKALKRRLHRRDRTMRELYRDAVGYRARLAEGARAEIKEGIKAGVGSATRLLELERVRGDGAGRAARSLRAAPDAAFQHTETRSRSGREGGRDLQGLEI